MRGNNPIKNPKDGATSKGQCANVETKAAKGAYLKTCSGRKRKAIWFLLPSGRALLVGQNARTLSALINSGKAGVTALELSSWAFRLGSYIHTLRSQYGLDIITIKETHNELGDWHARYVLNCDVQILEMA
ncbi:hypothetical protein LPB140_06900 [Sphingorhabdus lutea]|uniref:Winged helix domain-containing protein n=1 Tax=Sphingorhabdus lutea TaxID=1913578 RepID=A0A1L3JBP8_9SPHN|nr:hypothetical protein LPB140_06900 [Sphingorhabdus lutea]